MAECKGRTCSACGEENCGDRTTPNAGLSLQEGSDIKKIIAVASGKGGVGKSFSTSLLACELARRGRRVGILDGDITGPSIPRSFGIHSAPKVDDSGHMLPARSEKLDIAIVSTNMLTADEATPFLWRGPILNGILTQFYSDISWGELDYLFVDMPPGTGDVPMTVFQQFPLKGVIVATAPQVLVNMIVEKAIRMAEHMDIPVLGLVENMSYYVCPDCGSRHEIFGKSEVEAIAAEKGIDAWTRVPMDPKISELVDEGHVEDIEGDWFVGLADKLESIE